MNSFATTIVSHRSMQRADKNVFDKEKKKKKKEEKKSDGKARREDEFARRAESLSKSV